MSIYVCLDCFTEYSSLYFSIVQSSVAEHFRYEKFCVMTNCDGRVVELDELIAPAIILLNQKGYYTNYCCSGHFYGKGDSSFYVQFSEHDFYSIPYERFDTIPKGFTMKFDDSPTIRYNLKHGKKLGSSALLKEITKVNLAFLEWVERLEVLKEEDAM